MQAVQIYERPGESDLGNPSHLDHYSGFHDRGAFFCGSNDCGLPMLRKPPTDNTLSAVRIVGCPRRPARQQLAQHSWSPPCWGITEDLGAPISIAGWIGHPGLSHKQAFRWFDSSSRSQFTGVAQSGSAPGLGPGGCQFKSEHPYQAFPKLSRSLEAVQTGSVQFKNRVTRNLTDEPGPNYRGLGGISDRPLHPGRSGWVYRGHRLIV